MARDIIGDAAIKILPETRYFARDVGRQLSGPIRSTFGRLAGLAAGAFAGVKIARFVGDSINEALEAKKVAGQVNAVIKSTGKIAHVSAKQVDELSDTLSDVAGVDDEIISRGAALLLTFTNVRNEVGKGNQIFDQALTAATDLSAALGQDMQSSVIQLGKALNDPIRGVTALRRVGVSFTQSQQNQIKALVKSNDLLGAQRLILAELTKEFGGAAAATATPWDRMRVAIDNLKEAVGTALLPTLERFANFVSSTLVPFLENEVIPRIVELASDFGKIVAAVGPAAQGVVQAFFEGFTEGDAKKAQDRVHGMADDGLRLNDVLREFGRVMSDDVAPAFRTLGSEISGKEGFGAALSSLGGFLVDAEAKLNSLLDTLGRFAPTIEIGLVGPIALMDRNIRPVFLGTLGFIGETVGKIKRLFERFGPFIRDHVEDALLGLPGIIQAGVIGFGDLLVGAGQDLIEGLIRGIWSMAGRLVRSIKEFVKRNIPKPIRDALGIKSPSKVFMEIGRQTMEGLLVGLLSQEKALTETVRRIGGTIDLGVTRPDVALESRTTPVGAGPRAPVIQYITTASTDVRVLANELLHRAERESQR